MLKIVAQTPEKERHVEDPSERSTSSNYINKKKQQTTFFMGPKRTY